MPTPNSAEVAFVRPGDVQTRLRGVDWAIGELAGGQYGVVSRGQLTGLGLGREAIAGRVAAGRLHRLHPGVHAVGHKALAAESYWIAAVLSAGAALSHRSAARLWGLTSEGSDAIDVTSPRRTRSIQSIRRHFLTLAPDEVTSYRGIPTTTASRTVFDLAAALSVSRLEAVMRKAEFLRLHGRLSLPALLARHPGHRGNAKLRLCLERFGDGIGFTRSELEDRFVALLDRNGLPRPRLNARLEIAGTWMEVDCLWASRHLIVELDGHRAHGTRAAFEVDRERDRRLQAQGWRVLRVTWRQLHGAEQEVVHDLRRMLRELQYKRT